MLFYFRWLPGRAWVQSVTRHSPASCLPAAGWKLRTWSAMPPLAIGGVQFDFRHYVFTEGGNSIHVFHCIYEDGVRHAPVIRRTVSQLGRLCAVLDRVRNPGMRLLGLTVWGADPDRAELAFEAQLRKAVVIGTPQGATASSDSRVVP